MKYPRSIQTLINLFAELPSVGPKTAERYVFYLLRQNPEYLQRLAQTIAELKEKTAICKNCLAISESGTCEICADKKRDASQLCVVASTRDMLTIEATRQYSGYYHILGGVLNAIEGIKPENLNIKLLNNKIDSGKVKELILGLNPNLEGETTALYLSKIYKTTNIKITRLARGLPSGANLEYADEITLADAFKNRREIL